MADYYSILKKTIASLPESNGAARRSVYSRARNAIVNQLKAYEPPLSPSEITAEQLRLEEAIRKVEAEAARESLGLTPAAVAAAPAVEPPSPAPQPDETPVAEDPVAAVPVVADPIPDHSVAPESSDLPPADKVIPEPAAEAVSEYPEDIPSPLQDTLTEAEALGTAANQAVQQAKEAVVPVSGTEPVTAEPQRQEPVFDQTAPSDDGLFEDEKKTDATEEIVGPDQDIATGAPAKVRAKRERPSASDALRSSSSSSRVVPIALALILVLALLGAGAYYFLPLGDLVSVNRQDTEPGTTQAENTAPSNAPVTAPDTGQVTDEDPGSKNTDRLLDGGENEVIAPDARTVTTTTINPETNEPVTAPAQPPITSDTQAVPTLIQPQASQSGVTAPTGAETTEPAAVPQDNLAAIEPETAAPEDPPAGLTGADGAAQRSILYEEGEDAGGAGTASQGAVVWGVAEETNLDGRQQSILTASIDIPERDVKVDIRIKPNDDTSLPASHLVEIKYDFPDSFAAGDVVNVPGLVMKPTEEARGDALIGASVKVQPGFFWIALSSLPNEQQRNLALLRERGWIDIPMLYENGKRGILTLEKGAVGADAVEKAVSAWQAG
ncbi:hypothetical protein ABVF61_10270 [Roseibium sp. HPY-6]|uniref:hypothetical protein n=1 Tax=Roseibium sp. HPY-6 TaxID=3229852 RepID=UPI00338DEBBE